MQDRREQQNPERGGTCVVSSRRTNLRLSIHSECVGGAAAGAARVGAVA